MPDEAIEALDESPDTPSPEETPVEASAETTSEEPSKAEIDWQKRYEDLRPQWDRTKQQLSQYEQFTQALQNDPQATIRALQEQFADAEDDGDDDEFEDPGERALQILQEQQETAQQQADRERRQAVEEQYVAEGIDALTKRDNVELSDHAQAVLYALSTHDSLRGEDGRPDVESAYEALRDFEKEVRERYVSSKKSPRIPNGRPGEKSIDLDNEDDALKYMQEIFESSTLE